MAAAMRSPWNLLAILLVCGGFAEFANAEKPTIPLDEGHIIAPNAPLSASKKSEQRNKARAKALAAIAGLIILGAALIAATWMGGRMTRRYMKSSEKPIVHPIDSAFTDDWASKPLTPEERNRLESSEW